MPASTLGHEMQASLVLTRAPFVTIAEIRGQAHGLGSQSTLACGLRFASREAAGELSATAS